MFAQDIFSTGTVLWELLTGRGLFRSESEAETIHSLRFAEIGTPTEVAPHVPAALSRVCMRALERAPERAPERRYPTAADFAEDLETAARASSGIGTQREVAAYVARVMGPAQRPSTSAALAGAVPAATGRRPETVQLPESEPLLRNARR